MVRAAQNKVLVDLVGQYEQIMLGAISPIASISARVNTSRHTDCPVC